MTNVIGERSNADFTAETLRSRDRMGNTENHKNTQRLCASAVYISSPLPQRCPQLLELLFQAGDFGFGGV